MNNLKVIKTFPDNCVEGIYANCSGKSDSDELLAVGTLSIDLIENDSITDRLDSCDMTMAEFNIFSYKGSTTIQIDFIPDAYEEYKKTSTLLNKWFDEEYDNENQLLSFTLIPYYYCGEIIIVFNNLIYFDCYQLEKGNGYRVILTYDESETKFLQTDGIEFDAYVKEAEERESSEIRSLELEIDQINDEIEELKNQDNVYAQRLDDSLRKFNDPMTNFKSERNTEESEDSNFRSSSEE